MAALPQSAPMERKAGAECAVCVLVRTLALVRVGVCVRVRVQVCGMHQCGDAEDDDVRQQQRLDPRLKLSDKAQPMGR